MNAAEIRADMIAELRAAARGCACIGARQMQLAGSCRNIASQLNREADRIEESARADARPTESTHNPQPSTHNPQPSTLFSQTPTATGRADESTAEPVVFKLNSAASSSADNFKEAA